MIFRLASLVRSGFLIPSIIALTAVWITPTAVAQVNLYEQTLNVVSFGGAYTRSQMLAYVRPWEAQTGKYANMHSYGGGVNEIEAQVSAANVLWDVVDMESNDLITACSSGLLEPFDSSLIEDGSGGMSAADDIPQNYAQDCGYPSVIWSTVLSFSHDAFSGDKPSTVADFFNLEKFPGKRGLRQNPKGLLEWVLLANGTSMDDVYSVLSTPQGVDSAFELATPLRSSIVWWNSGDEPAKLLSQGTVSMSSAWNGRLYGPIVEEKLPIEIIWDGQMLEIEYWAILKGSPRMANAKDFVRFAMQTENMANQSSYISYGPTRMSANALISEDVKPHLPTSNLDSSVRVDSQFWAEHGAQINELFEQWLTPSVDELDRAVRF